MDVPLLAVVVAINLVNRRVQVQVIRQQKPKVHRPVAIALALPPPPHRLNGVLGCL